MTLAIVYEFVLLYIKNYFRQPRKEYKKQQKTNKKSWTLYLIKIKLVTEPKLRRTHNSVAHVLKILTSLETGW